MKEGFIIIKITKNEKDYLLTQGFSWGTNRSEGIIHRTFSKGKKKTYYMTESPEAMKAIKEYRKNIVCEF